MRRLETRGFGRGADNYRRTAPSDSEAVGDADADEPNDGEKLTVCVLLDERVPVCVREGVFVSELDGVAAADGVTVGSTDGVAKQSKRMRLFPLSEMYSPRDPRAVPNGHRKVAAVPMPFARPDE